MRILLAAATKNEMLPILDQFKPAQVAQNLFTATKPSNTIDFLITGIGILSTGVEMGSHLKDNTYDLAVNLGIAGTYAPSFVPGEVVEVISDGPGGFGAMDEGQYQSVFKLGLIDTREPPWVNGRIVASFQLHFQSLRKLRKVHGLTVQLMNAESMLNRTDHQHQPEIETMEGAAFFFACHKFQIPCLQLRAISNAVNERDRSKWHNHLAINNLNDMIIKIVGELASQ